MELTYRSIRNLHLYLGLFFMLFLLMYAVSAVQMAHPSWFDLTPTVTETRFPVPAQEASDPSTLATYLRADQGIRGELGDVEATDTGFAFRVVRPGTVHEVRFEHADGEVHVRTSVAGFMGMLNRIHHLGGLHHEYALLDVWGVFVGLTSVGLILLGLSGVYMWFHSHRKRRTAGGLLLTFSLTVSLTLIVLMRLA